MKLKKILKISRPRFWLYEAGTFLLGVSFFGFFSKDLNWIDFIIWFFYFLIPANILIYGVNDIFDYETDLKNPKKYDYEELVLPREHKDVWFYILGFNIPFIFLAFSKYSFEVFFWLIVFIFFAVFYSAKPIRAKSKPFLDSFFSASHYVATGIFGYVLFSQSQPNFFIVLSGILWAMSMHAFSAIPDIEADKDAQLKTVATFLGFNKTLYLCALFYFLSFLIASFYLSFYFILFLIPYLFLIYKTYKNQEKIFTYYKFFPMLNSIFGFIIFFWVALKSFY